MKTVARDRAYQAWSFEFIRRLRFDPVRALGWRVMAILFAGTPASEAAMFLQLPNTFVEGSGVLSNAANLKLGSTATSNVIVLLSSLDPALISVPDVVAALTNGQSNVTFNRSRRRFEIPRYRGPEAGMRRSRKPQVQNGSTVKVGRIGAAEKFNRLTRGKPRRPTPERHQSGCGGLGNGSTLLRPNPWRFLPIRSPTVRRRFIAPALIKRRWSWG
jgi:hypothetical protein